MGAARPAWRVLPFESASFDAIIASSLLEYVDDPEAVLRECGRLLRPGGVVLCTVPDVRHPVRWLEKAAQGYSSLRWGQATPFRSQFLDGYMTYLQVSLQRHPDRWWRVTADQAGLHPVPYEVGRHRPSPLRFLMFRRSDDSLEDS